MRAQPNFNPEWKWYTGQGCVVCGANYSDQGAAAGIQAVDLDVADPVLGHIGLCYLHAREVGAHVGMVDAAEIDKARIVTDEVYDAAAEARFAAELEHLAAQVERERTEQVLDELQSRMKKTPGRKPAEAEVVE